MVDNASNATSILDSLTTYFLAFFLLAFTTVIANAGAIMTIGGLVLLGLRLFVDWMKAYRAYQEHKEWKRVRTSR